MIKFNHWSGEHHETKCWPSNWHIHLHTFIIWIWVGGVGGGVTGSVDNFVNRYTNLSQPFWQLFFTTATTDKTFRQTLASLHRRESPVMPHKCDIGLSLCRYWSLSHSICHTHEKKNMIEYLTSFVSYHFTSKFSWNNSAAFVFNLQSRSLEITWKWPLVNILSLRWILVTISQKHDETWWSLNRWHSSGWVEWFM